ncbi:MAG: hypothetical protein PVF43_12615 [Candidatus Eiseniibacteriota bacterium]
MGYERLGGGEDADTADPVAGTGPPRFWFTEPRDGVGALQLWVRWKQRPIGRLRSHVILEYERQQWIEGNVLSRNVYGLELRQEITRRDRLELEIEYTPQVYVTHRSDDDAPPGAPEFRPDAYEQVEWALGHRHRWGRGIDTTVHAEYTIRTETEWFRERDRKRWGGGLELDTPLWAGLRANPEYTYRVNRARNEPDLGKDISYREHVIDLTVSRRNDWPGGPWELDLITRWKLRNYTTDDVDDQRRFGRSDRWSSWQVRVRRPLGAWTPFVVWKKSGRDVSVPEEDLLDDFTDIARDLVQLGVEWRWERDD